MSHNKTLSLSSGAKIPQIGFGTWQAEPNVVGNAVETAVRHGYRHLDLAFQYGNQNEVGDALRRLIPSVVQRDDLFITSKLWNHSHQSDKVEKELDETLKQLGVDYLDLYLMHWPVAFKPGNEPMPEKDGLTELDLRTTVAETWKAMIALPLTKVRAVGVANFTLANLERLIEATGVVPAVNQVEAHPYLQQEDLFQFCKSKGIHITAYSPLGNNMIEKPMVIDDPEVDRIAGSIGATPAQVTIAWGARRGYSVIPKSTTREHIESNFTQVDLSEEAYERITRAGNAKSIRFNIPFRYQPKWDINVFDEAEEKAATHSVRIS